MRTTEAPSPHPELKHPSAAAALASTLPRDQALGLRLIALARAASAMHMSLNAGITQDLAHSQAGALVREARS